MTFCMTKFQHEAAAFLHFFCHAKAKLPSKHWTLIFIENIVFTILSPTFAPSVASRFPLCIQYVITKFIYLPFVMDLIKRDHGISGSQPLTQLHIEFTSVIAILRLIPLLYKIISERSMFLNRPKTLLYLQNGKAQISISSVSQTKELITGTGNRDQVFLATPLGLFSNLPGPLPITSCVKQV